MDKKECVRCHETKPIAEFYTIRNRKRKRAHSYCKLCTREVNQQRSAEPPEQTSRRAQNWREKNWARNVLNNVRSNARSRGLVCEITEDLLEYLWETQEGLCALSRVPMTKTYGAGRIHTNTSVDRIDSTRGYVSDNVWLVCAIINRMKQELEVAEFQSWCEYVVRARQVSTAK